MHCFTLLLITIDVEHFVIRESVDSLCRDGADMARPFFHIEWLRTPKLSSYKPF